MSLLHIGWSCGPEQIVALGAVPYNLGCIASLKKQLTNEQAQVNPSDETIRKIQKDIFACWKAIDFHKKACVPIVGTVWETEEYWKKKKNQDDLHKLLSLKPELVLNDYADLEKRLTELFTSSAPRDYNPDFARYTEIKDRAFGLIRQLYESNPNTDEFTKNWPTIKTDLQKLDLS